MNLTREVGLKKTHLNHRFGDTHFQQFFGPVICDFRKRRFESSSRVPSPSIS